MSKIKKCKCEDSITSTQIFNGRYHCKRCGGDLGAPHRDKDGNPSWGWDFK